MIHLAWKNIWRNKPRSLIVVFAITLGTIAGVFTAGLMNGWLLQRIGTVVYTEQGQIKIQNPEYLVNEESQHYIPDSPILESVLDTLKCVKAYSPRMKVATMASTAGGSTGLILKGVEPEKEKMVSNLYKQLVINGGTFFEEPSKFPQIVISAKTAEQLRIKNFKITQKVLDSLLVQRIPEPTVNKLSGLLDQRFDAEKKFKKEIKKCWNEHEIRNYGPMLWNTATYIKLKSKINVSFSRADGQLGFQTFQVCGVFKTTNTMFDQQTAFVLTTDLAKTVGLNPNQYHEVSILLNHENPLVESQHVLKSAFGNLSVLTWKELAPDAGMMSDFMDIYYYLIMGIIFFALAFGIINTMLMTILERVKEFGMLMAIGMKKKRVFTMILLETVLLTLTGSIIGMLLGAGIIGITHKTGLSFSSVAEGFEAMGWSATVYPQIESSFFMGVTVLVICIGILASIIPAKKATKLKPVEALRID